MLLTIKTKHAQASELGFLLHKHPDKVQTFKIVGGQAHTYYPVNSVEEASFCLLIELDSIELVRSLKVPGESIMLQHYVNDRPYVASSFTSSAIAKVLGSALNGRCENRPELLDIQWPFEVEISVLRAKGGPASLSRVFEPLGYKIEADRQILDPKFPQWGDSAYYQVRLQNQLSLSQLLSHLYVLLPVFDDEQHYWVSKNEVEKLQAKGSDWLPEHPEREWITKRYLKNIGSLIRMVNNRLLGEAERENPTQAENPAQKEKRIGLHQLRLNAALEALQKSGANQILDLGCGEGKLIRMLLKHSQFKKILGMDVSYSSLKKAAARLHLDEMSPRMRERIELIQGSLTYHDARLNGYDAAVLVEVIEHLELERLSAFERVVFEFARPQHIILTTPNAEYNQLYPSLVAGGMRHDDHRFEWTRAEFQTWVNDIGEKYAYDAQISPIGEVDPDVGPSSQMVVFTLKTALT